VADAVYKKVELVGTSPNSFTEAVSNAIAQAARSMGSISWFEVVEQRGSVVDGQVQQFQVTLKVGCREP